MGYDRLTFEGWARVSRHNSSRDNNDNARWNQFVRKLHKLAEEYADIDLDVAAHPIEGYPVYGRDPHPQWVALGRWGPSESYLRVDEGASGAYEFQCGNCGREVHQNDEACFEESWIDGSRPEGCGVWFTQITIPFERGREAVEALRPDLEYVVLRWA